VKRTLKLAVLLVPWFVIWLLGVICALLADAFTGLQDWLGEILAELNEEVEKL